MAAHCRQAYNIRTLCRELCKKGCTGRDAAVDAESVGSKEPRTLAAVHIGVTWLIRLNRACAAAMRPFVRLF